MSTDTDDRLPMLCDDPAAFRDEQVRRKAAEAKYDEACEAVDRMTRAYNGAQGRCDEQKARAEAAEARLSEVERERDAYAGAVAWMHGRLDDMKVHPGIVGAPNSIERLKERAVDHLPAIIGVSVETTAALRREGYVLVHQSQVPVPVRRDGGKGRDGRRDQQLHDVAEDAARWRTLRGWLGEQDCGADEPGDVMALIKALRDHGYPELKDIGVRALELEHTPAASHEVERAHGIVAAALHAPPLPRESAAPGDAAGHLRRVLHVERNALLDLADHDQPHDAKRLGQLDDALHHLDRIELALAGAPSTEGPDGLLKRPDPFPSPGPCDTDGAAPADVLAAVRHCCTCWEPLARVIGNVRAQDIERAIDHFLRPSTEGPPDGTAPERALLRDALHRARAALAHEENELNIFSEAGPADDRTAIANIAAIAMHNVIVDIDSALAADRATRPPDGMPGDAMRCRLCGGEIGGRGTTCTPGCPAHKTASQAAADAALPPAMRRLGGPTTPRRQDYDTSTIAAVSMPGEPMPCCAVCRKPQRPLGRDVAAAAGADYCDPLCSGRAPPTVPGEPDLPSPCPPDSTEEGWCWGEDVNGEWSPRYYPEDTVMRWGARIPWPDNDDGGYDQPVSRIDEAAVRADERAKIAAGLRELAEQHNRRHNAHSTPTACALHDYAREIEGRTSGPTPEGAAK